MGGTMEELWKAIPGYDGIYEASNMGRIRSTNNGRKKHIMKPCADRNRRCKGYDRRDYRVVLYKDRKPSSMRVARLVGMTWVDGYAPEMTVDHINGDSTDNRACNLQWLTRGDNIRKAFAEGRYTNVGRKRARLIA